MIKVGFVILHYLAYEMTCECVDNLLNNFSENISNIVIVDNCSSNGSGDLLIEKYKNQKIVIVLKNKENLGFAKGNNIGYKWLKEKNNSDFIVVMNNDVLINDKSFVDKIISCYNQTNFDVMGPDIFNPKTHCHQSPIRENSIEVFEIEKTIKQLQKRLKYLRIYTFRHILFSWLRKFLNKKSNTKFEASLKSQENVVLHGACYILSKSFINKMEYVFYPETFLYFEEDILHLLCMKKNLKMIFNPTIQVYHLEDIATNIEFNSYYKKEKMKIPTLIDSMKIYLKLKQEG